MNLKFGTGGLRATMGPGPDHMNLETIQEATLGVAAYAKEQSDHPSAALAYDLLSFTLLQQRYNLTSLAILTREN